MITTTATWLVLTVGIILAVIALGTRSVRMLRRLRDAAMIQVAASAALGVVIWGTPAEASLAPTRDLALMALGAASLGILVLFLVTGRRQQYLPLLGESPEAETRLYGAVACAITHEPTLNRMLMGVASALRAATGASAALVYKIDSTRKQSLYVGSAVPAGSVDSGPPTRDQLSSLALEYAVAGCTSEYRPDNKQEHSGASAVWGIIPLATGQNVQAVVLLESPGVSVSTPPHSSTIMKAAELAGRSLSDWIGATRGVTNDRLVRSFYHLSADLLDERSLERGLSAIARSLQGIVPVDYLSVSWLNRAHFHEDRASMIVGQRRVVESRRKWPIWDGTTSRLLGMARPLITPDMLQVSDEAPNAELWESRLGLRSRIVVPIRDGQRLLGTLTLAHKDIARYGLEETGPLTAMALPIGQWLKRLEANRLSRRYSEVMQLANRWDSNAFKSKSDHDLLDEAHRAIRTSALRLYRLTPDGDAMEAVASAGRTDDRADCETRIPLIQTPWHRWSREDKSPRRVDQSDAESLMGKTEAELSMIPRMKTGWIVPITSSGRTIGFVDAMETRDPDRRSLDEPERLLLAALARLFARRWVDAPESSVYGAERRKWQDRIADLNHNIINPVTGIVGSVELIRHKQPVLSDESVKYLNIIERAAVRIHAAVVQSLNPDELGTSSVPADGSTRHPLQRIPNTSMDEATQISQSTSNRLQHWRLEQPAGVTMAGQPIL